MHSRANIFTGLVMIFALSGAPGVSANAVTLGEAHTLYFNQYEASQTGIIVDSGIVFSTVVLPYSKDMSRNTIKAKAMVVAGKQIGAHFIPQFQPVSTGSIALDEALIGQRDIKLNKLPSRVLVNKREGESYRYVLAVEESTIKDVFRNDPGKTVSDSEISAVLYHLNAGKYYRYLGQILSELGLPEMALLWEKKELAKESCLTNYYQPSPIPFYERNKTQELQADLAPALDWLCELPANPYVIQYHLKQNALPKSTVLAFESTMLPALNTTGYEQASSEWVKSSLKYLDSLAIPVDLSSPYSAALSFPGHIWFSSAYSDEPTEAFFRAKSLFEKGVGLDQIIISLKEGINLSPRHIASWQYLGAALIARNNWQEAAVVYLQWLTLEPENIEAISRYAEALYRMGLSSEAARFIPYLQFYSSTNKFAQQSIQLIEKK